YYFVQLRIAKVKQTTTNGIDSTSHRLQEGFASLGIERGLQVFAGAQDDVTDKRVRLFDEPGEDAADSGPVRRTIGRSCCQILGES
ncbi:MAG: hypothetical protein MZV65_00855, partial [Chromatiales bacterium]|nr:hypothetical protein [Chromatiales bacterium]